MRPRDRWCGGLALAALALASCSRTDVVARATGAPTPGKLEARSIYEPVGQALVRLCRVAPRELSSGALLGDAWVPQPVRDLRGTLSVASDGARLYFGDRDHSWGYRLARAPGAAAAWRLDLFGRGAKRR